MLKRLPKYLFDVFPFNTVYQQLISDRNWQLVNILWKRICRIFGIQRKFSTIYHPLIDGATERMNQTMETFLRIYIDLDQRNLIKLLFITELVINNKNAALTGINFFSFFSPRISPQNPGNRRKAVSKKKLSKEQMGQFTNCKKRLIGFKWLWLSTNKINKNILSERKFKVWNIK